MNHIEHIVITHVIMVQYCITKGIKMQIITKNISELQPYGNNPRINDKAIELVANSIKEFGFKVPIIIDKDNVIVAGHTRYNACQVLGLTEVPCIVADDLTEKQVKAFRIADNKVSDYSIWDNKLLLQELDDIGEDIFTGFETSEILEDISSLSELDTKDETLVNENEHGVTYKISFSTQNKELIEKLKIFLIENGAEI